MRSIDKENNNSETLLVSFENTLQKQVDRLREKKEEISRQDLKTFIRFYCKKNAQNLGLTEEETNRFIPYFFTCLYENPEAKKKMWGILYELSNSTQDQEKTEALFEQLLEQNDGGLTHLWRIVRNIVRGEYDVQQKTIEGQAIYAFVPAENAQENLKDPQRQQASKALKEKVQSNIVDKPIPDTGTESIRMTEQDRKLFFKIFHYLQSDADALITSEEWHPIIGKYFTGITKHLLSTIKLLDVKQNKSSKRKQRYKDFIVHALQTYVKPLLAYCKQITETPNEANPFANDILFETYITENNLLDGPKEPSYTAIENKWQLLYKKMRRYIEDDATMYGLPTIAEPDQFGPQVTDELRKDDLKTIRDNSSIAFDKTLIMGAQQSPVTKKDGIEKEKDDWADVWENATEKKEKEPIQSLIDNTAAMSAIITKEIDRFPNMQRRNKQAETPTMLGSHYIAVAPGSEAEGTLLATIRQDINALFSKYHHEITRGNECDNFTQAMANLMKEKISTPKLMDHFFMCVLAHYEDLRNKEEKPNNENIFNNITASFNHLAQEISLPLPIAKEIGYERNKQSSIPSADIIEEAKNAIPSIDNPAFAALKTYLEDKSLYDRFKKIETLMRETMIEKGIIELEALNKLNQRLRLAVSSIEGFTYYHYEQQKEINDAYKDIKKLSGNWLTKHFKFGRSAKVKQEMEEYLTSLTMALETTWNHAMQPLLVTYGTIVFGSDLYVQQQ
jgi:hypothetical protein